MTKFSGVPPNAAPSLADFLMGVTAGNVDDKVLISNILKLLQNNNLFTVQSQANGGGAGGTMFYINLGGIKILWCNCNNVVGTAGGNANQVNWPTSFFTTAPVAVVTLGPNATSNQQIVNIGGGALTTSNLIFNVQAPSTTAAEFAQVIAIGT